MATEKQIAANRANAKLSAGPKTSAGKQRSARNALTHGLSIALDEAGEQLATEMAAAIADKTAAELLDCLNFARAHVAVERVRAVQLELLRNSFSLSREDGCTRLIKIERYERAALNTARRAAKQISVQE